MKPGITVALIGGGTMLVLGIAFVSRWPPRLMKGSSHAEFMAGEATFPLKTFYSAWYMFRKRFGHPPASVHELDGYYDFTKYMPKELREFCRGHLTFPPSKDVADLPQGVIATFKNEEGTSYALFEDGRVVELSGIK